MTIAIFKPLRFFRNIAVELSESCEHYEGHSTKVRGLFGSHGVVPTVQHMNSNYRA